MSSVTLTVPDDLAERLRPLEGRLTEILELGLREISASPGGFTGASELFEFLARLPGAKETLALRPSPQLEERVRFLLAKNRDGALTASEQEEWERYQYLEHLVRIAKAQARIKLGVSGSDA